MTSLRLLFDFHCWGYKHSIIYQWWRYDHLSKAETAYFVRDDDSLT